MVVEASQGLLVGLRRMGETTTRMMTPSLVVRSTVMPSLIVLNFAMLGLGACASRPAVSVVEDEPATEPGAAPVQQYQEQPVPEGDWRPHWLARCAPPERLPTPVETCLAESRSLLRMGVGSDAIMELELCLAEQGVFGQLLLTLAQLYVLAGQGEPELLPTDGPAADVGDWSRNQERLLGRAEALLAEAGQLRLDDAVVDYLLADAARARAAFAAADSLFDAALGKCSRQRSIQLLRVYQQLNNNPARLQSDVVPEYPAAANRAGISGDVVLDLLIDPRGRPVQFVTVASPDADLTAAAVQAVRSAEFAPAKVGKYPIWSWLRLSTRFALSGSGAS